MSENNQQNEALESKSKLQSEPSNENNSSSHSRTNVEDLHETDAILSDIKTDIQTEETTVNIEDAHEKHIGDGKNVDNVDYLLYAEYGQQIRPPRTTWIYVQAGPGAALPPGEAPLDYEPSRNGFIRLVFSIVLIMILITAGFVAIVLTSDSLTDTFQRKGFLLAIPAMITMIALSYAIACSPCVRVFPCNIIILVIAVICMSIICAWITSRYDTKIVFYALLATCLVVIVCILLAFSGFDFTAWMLYVVVIAAAFGAVTMVVFVAMMITGTYMKTLHLVILIIGTVLNAVIFTMELQMIIGGGAIELSEYDYALGAFLIYTSIVDIFLQLVQILGILDSM